MQHDRIPLEDDFEVLQARTSSLHGPGNLPFDSARSPLRGQTTWNVGNTWAPEDDPELALDSDDSWYEIQMEADVGDLIDSAPVDERSRPRPRKSQASVRFMSYLSTKASNELLRRALECFGKSTQDKFISKNLCDRRVAETLFAIQNVLIVCQGEGTSPMRQNFGARTASFQI